jgi:hypothetical protein
MRLALLGLALAAACGSPKQAPPAPADCGHAWRLETESLGVVTVASAGRVRLDFDGKQMFGSDSREWLACMPTCPGGAAEPVCIPYHFKLSISGETDKSCTRSDADGGEWKGRPSRLARFACPSGTIELRWVPSLAPVRDALLAVGAIAPASALTGFDGLVVEMKLGAETVFAIGDVRDAACADLVPPGGHRMVDRAADFAAMRQMAPGLERTFQAATAEAARQLSDSILAEGRAAALTALGRRCLGERPSYDPAEVQTCLAAHPEIPVQQVTGDAILEVANRRAPEQAAIMTQAIRTHVDQPLCARFAPKSP